MFAAAEALADPLAATAIRGKRGRQVTLGAGQIPEHADVPGVVLPLARDFDIAVALGDLDLGCVVEHGLLMPTGVEQRNSVSSPAPHRADAGSPRAWAAVSAASFTG